MSLGYTSGEFRFPFRTVKVLTLWDNVRWALRGAGLSSGLASYPPQYQKGTWLRARFPFFFENGPWVPFGPTFEVGARQVCRHCERNKIALTP